MKNLYVGNLPHSTTEADLRSLFEAHGAVEKITLVTDRDTGRSRGFGFVEMFWRRRPRARRLSRSSTSTAGTALVVCEHNVPGRLQGPPPVTNRDMSEDAYA